MKTRLLFAAAVAAVPCPCASAASAEDAMSKPGMDEADDEDRQQDGRKLTRWPRQPDKMQKPGIMMMDKKDSMSKDEHEEVATAAIAGPATLRARRFSTRFKGMTKSAERHDQHRRTLTASERARRRDPSGLGAHHALDQRASRCW